LWGEDANDRLLVAVPSDIADRNLCHDPVRAVRSESRRWFQRVDGDYRRFAGRGDEAEDRHKRGQRAREQCPPDGGLTLETLLGCSFASGARSCLPACTVLWRGGNGISG
jgi:hypothetical protein